MIPNLQDAQTGKLIRHLCGLIAAVDTFMIPV